MEKVTVVIPLYNKERAIKTTLLSVLNQTYKDFEVVAVDDGSTDSSAAIVKEIAANDSRVKYYHKQNGGVSSARNYGLSKAKGKWVVFLDADDEMLPHNIDHLLGLTEIFHVMMAAANVTVSKGNGNFRKTDLRTTGVKLHRNYIKALIRHRGVFASGACIYNRELLGEKPYNENLSRYEDCEFELNLFVKGPVVFSSTPVLIHHEEFAELSKIQSQNKNKDFIFNMDFRNKTFWQKVYMGRFVNEGCYIYTDGAKLLKRLYGMQYYWRYIFWFISKFYGAIYRIDKVFKIS